jgi:hypothetical protein
MPFYKEEYFITSPAVESLRKLWNELNGLPEPEKNAPFFGFPTYESPDMKEVADDR